MNFATIRIFRQNPSQLYHIVSNVDSYHEFVPFIINSKVTSFDTIIKRLNGYKMTRLRGSLTVGMPATAFISPFSYDSVVSLEERIKGLELYRVKAECPHHTLFDSLSATWTIGAVDPECKMAIKRIISNQTSSLLDAECEKKLHSFDDTARSIVVYEMRINAKNQLLTSMLTHQLQNIAGNSYVDAFVSRANALFP